MYISIDFIFVEPPPVHFGFMHCWDLDVRINFWIELYWITVVMGLINGSCPQAVYLTMSAVNILKMTLWILAGFQKFF